MPWDGRLHSVTDIILVPRREVVRGLCHLLEGPIESVQVPPKVLGYLLCAIWFGGLLALDARVVLIPGLRVRVTDY